MNHPGRSAQRTEAVDISKSRIAEELERSRRRVHALTACDEEELLKQHSPLMSPLVWDLAHVGSHEVHVPGYWIDTVPVSNAAFAEFVEDGGYDRPDRWSAAGWAHRQDAGLSAPRF